MADFTNQIKYTYSMIKYIAVLLTLLLLVSSCVTLEKCQNRFGECGRVETVTVREYRDTTVYIKGETLYDTLAFYERDTFYLTDTSGRLTAEIGRIKDTKTHYIRITSKPDTVRLERIKEVIKEGKTKYVDKPYIPYYYWFILAIPIIALFGVLFRR